MKMYKIFSMLSLIFLLFPVYGDASRIYFEPQEDTIGTEGKFFVDVLLDADEDVNTVSVAINFSDGLVPVDTRDSNSLITLWIDKPNWDEASQELTFSGLIPGGYSGERMRLLVLEIVSEGETGNTERLSFNHDKTEVLLNSPTAGLLPIGFDDFLLPIQKGKQNLPVDIVDADPPESFVPLIAEYDDTFGGKRVVVFSTVDKGLGMCCYQVAEKEGRQEYDYKKLRWRGAESPYILRDQSLRSFIYVKAIDKKGNERVMVLAPQSTSAGYAVSSVLGILIVVLVIIFSTIVYKRKRNAQNFYH